MLAWLLGVAIFVLLWGALWRTSPKAAFGAVFGFVIALVVYWIFSSQLTNYVIGMNEIPVWLPPLPFAVVIVVLFYFGIKTWLNADKLPPPPETDSHDEHGGHGQH